MSMETYFGSPRIMSSQEAEIGAKHLFEKISNGQIMMDVLPNRYAQFTGELEEKDYLSYCRFINSLNGKKVLSMLEDEDERNGLEL